MIIVSPGPTTFSRLSVKLSNSMASLLAFVIRSVIDWFAGTVTVWGVKRRFSKRSSITVSSPREPAAENRTVTKAVILKMTIKVFIVLPLPKKKKPTIPPILGGTMGSGFQDRWFLTAWQRCQAAQELHHSYCVNLFYIVSLGLFSPLDAALVCERQTRNVAGAIELFIAGSYPLSPRNESLPKRNGQTRGWACRCDPDRRWLNVSPTWAGRSP